MDHARAYSSPHLLSSSPSYNNGRQEEECGLEGLSTNVKLLLKIIQDHNGASTKDNEERKYQRVNGMMFMLDELRSRVQRIQSSTKRRAELRRCNTDLRSNIPISKDKRPHSDVPMDEKERLKKELTASMVARQSIQAMCSSLGKEKQIMASELARKAQELTEMEDLISDLKAQNHMLMETLRAYSSEQNEKGNNGLEMEGKLVLRERNEELSEQLHKSIDGYRSLKRELQEMQKEKKEIHATMEQMEAEVQAGIDRIHSFKEKMITTNIETEKIKEEISALERMFEYFKIKISKYAHKS